MAQRKVATAQVVAWQDYQYATAMAHPLQGINSFHGANLWLDNITKQQLFAPTQELQFIKVAVPGLPRGTVVHMQVAPQTKCVPVVFKKVYLWQYIGTYWGWVILPCGKATLLPMFNMAYPIAA
jgi:hypothetical protein